MKSRITKSMICLLAVAVLSSAAGAEVWFEDTIETDSPAVRWDSGDYKYMASQSVHGLGTLAPHGGGYKIVTGYPADQLYYEAGAGSSGAAGLWMVACAYALLADPTESHAGFQKVSMDLRISTMSATENQGFRWYPGQLGLPGELYEWSDNMYGVTENLQGGGYYGVVNDGNGTLKFRYNIGGGGRLGALWRGNHVRLGRRFPPGSRDGHRRRYGRLHRYQERRAGRIKWGPPAADGPDGGQWLAGRSTGRV